MIIQCDKCSTKFRIDDSKVTASGVKVRCTKCQNVFVAKPPQSEEAPKPQPEQPEGEGFGFDTTGAGGLTGNEPQPQSGAPQGGFDIGSTPSFGAAEPPEEEKKEYSIGSEYNMTESDYAQKAGAKSARFGVEAEAGRGEEQGWKITEEAPSKPAAGKTDEKTPLTLAGQAKRSFDETGAGEMPRSLAEGMDEGMEAGGGTTEDFGIGEEPATEEPAKKAAVSEPSSKGAFIVGIIIAVVIVIGGLAMRRAISSSSPKKPTAALEVEMLAGAFAENKNIGKIFVIQGKIKNVTDGAQQIRGVMGSIFDSSGKKVLNRMVSPGRTVSADDLKNMTKDELMKQFKDAKGAAIPPKGTVPVMIVFTDAPAGASEYGIEILR